jgi:hypothetical protein
VCGVVLGRVFKVIIKEIKVKGSFVCGGTMLYLEIRNKNLWVYGKVISLYIHY